MPAHCSLETAITAAGQHLPRIRSGFPPRSHDRAAATGRYWRKASRRVWSCRQVHAEYSGSCYLGLRVGSSPLRQGCHVAGHSACSITVTGASPLAGVMLH